MMKISSNDLTRFYSAVKARAECPVCDSTDWGLPTQEMVDDDQKIDLSVTAISPLVAHFSLKNLDKTATDQWFRAIPMLCNNCGFVRLQHWKVLATWLKANPETEAQPADTSGGEV
jgi:hypothetical protein